MPIQVEVRSNVDRLSASAVHRLLGDLVQRVAEHGAEALKVNVPKDTGALADHVSHTDSERGPYEIEAHIGIPPIEGENRRFQVGTKDLFAPGEQSSSHYPLFIDRGTGIFGPDESPIRSRRAHVMRWDGADGPVFRSEVKGQHGQHFMLETYEEARRVLLPAEAEIFHRRVKMLANTPDPPFN